MNVSSVNIHVHWKVAIFKDMKNLCLWLNLHHIFSNNDNITIYMYVIWPFQ